MTTITQSRPFGRTETGLRISEGLVERLQRSWAEWRLYQRTRTELEQLTDRDLSDLGISRYDIPAIARETVYGN